MSTTMFTEMRFWLLIAFLVVLPFGIYAVLLAKRAISRLTVLMFGFTLVVIAGVDVYLLQEPWRRRQGSRRHSPTMRSSCPKYRLRSICCPRCSAASASMSSRTFS